MRPLQCVSPSIFPHWQKCAATFALGILLLAGAAQEKVYAQEPMVSLSAGTIIEILRREPGLLLEVKRLLVRKAYEQGRLLDPADLSDDALFRLLREDDNVRVLATEEVEKREYVRPKPTRQEMEKDRIERVPGGQVANASGAAAVPLPQSEEEKYWARHEQPEAQEKTVASPDSRVNDGFSKDGFTEPETAAPPSGTSPVQPATPAPDYRRRQSLAGAQLQDRNSYEGAPPEAGSLPRISPEGMPGLLSASLDESGSSGQSLSARDALSARRLTPLHLRLRVSGQTRRGSPMLSLRRRPVPDSALGTPGPIPGCRSPGLSRTGLNWTRTIP